MAQAELQEKYSKRIKLLFIIHLLLWNLEHVQSTRDLKQENGASQLN